MSKIITSEILVSYSLCPHKAFLLMCAKTPGTPHEYIEILEQQRENNQQKYIHILQKEHPNVQAYNNDALKNGSNFLINAILETDGLVATCAILTKVNTHSFLGQYSYEPTIFVGTNNIQQAQKLELLFVGQVLEQIQHKYPTFGRIIGLSEQSHKVTLGNKSKILLSFLEPLQEWAKSSPTKPPPIILNKHCPICQFQDLCRAKANQEDNLSLLDGISTQKVINTYEKKGLFTVKQLSFTFKPRKHKKRSKNLPSIIHQPELRALAIRDAKTYLQELPKLIKEPVELFLDIEGNPEQKSYYLIGLLICDDSGAIYYPFWADAPEDEAQIWQQFLTKVNQYPNAPIYHYGSYEPKAIAKLTKRYDTDGNNIKNQLVNVNNYIYGKIYFPVYSNRLKEIGSFIGATWTTLNASGLQALVWRHYWEETRHAQYQDLLITYNKEDCQALKLLTDEISKMKESSDVLTKVDFADHRKKNASEVSQQVQNQFRTMLNFSYFDYDKKKINFRQELKKQDVKKGGARPSKIRPKPAKIIQVSQGQLCPKRKEISLRPSKKISKKLIIELALTKNGIKKTVTEYRGFYDLCLKCFRLYAPPSIAEFGRNQVYGHGFKAWLVYHRVALRLPYESIVTSLNEHFRQTINIGRVSVFIKDFAIYYAETEKTMIKRLLDNPFIHVDETTISIQGVNWYIWVFTDEKYVIFQLQETREATIVHEFLANYKGILISDFYPGYDSVNCRQQKCWVHLVRNLNDDLRESPFDAEYENFVLEVRNLIVPIMEGVQSFGLKKRKLNKFKKLVDEFYKNVITDKNYKSELTLKYQKRFIRYRNSLFTFLEQDGIPWHNNAAERALRHIAKQREISTSFQEKATKNYLVLLGINQTCRFQGKSFFKFLFSGETDLDKFEARKHKTHI